MLWWRAVLSLSLLFVNPMLRHKQGPVPTRHVVRSLPGTAVCCGVRGAVAGTLSGRRLHRDGGPGAGGGVRFASSAEALTVSALLVGNVAMVGASLSVACRTKAFALFSVSLVGG